MRISASHGETIAGGNGRKSTVESAHMAPNGIAYLTTAGNLIMEGRCTVVRADPDGPPAVGDRVLVRPTSGAAQPGPHETLVQAVSSDGRGGRPMVLTTHDHLWREPAKVEIRARADRASLDELRAAMEERGIL